MPGPISLLHRAPALDPAPRDPEACTAPVRYSLPRAPWPVDEFRAAAPAAPAGRAPAAPSRPLVEALVAQFPRTIAGSFPEVISFRGDEWWAGFDDPAPFKDYLVSLGVLPGAAPLSEEAAKAVAKERVALASGVFVNRLGDSAALTAIAVRPAREGGATPKALVEKTLALYGKPVEAQAVSTAAGDTVWTGVARAEGMGREIRVMAKNDVVWLVDAAELALPEIMARLPASGICGA